MPLTSGFLAEKKVLFNVWRPLCKSLYLLVITVSILCIDFRCCCVACIHSSVSEDGSVYLLSANHKDKLRDNVLFYMPHTLTTIVVISILWMFTAIMYHLCLCFQWTCVTCGRVLLVGEQLSAGAALGIHSSGLGWFRQVVIPWGFYQIRPSTQIYPGVLLVLCISSQTGNARVLLALSTPPH